MKEHILRSPYDRTEIRRIEHDTDEQMIAKLARAYEGYRAWRSVPLAERIKRVEKCAAFLLD